MHLHSKTMNVGHVHYDLRKAGRLFAAFLLALWVGSGIAIQLSPPLQRWLDNRDGRNEFVSTYVRDDLQTQWRVPSLVGMPLYDPPPLPPVDEMSLRRETPQPWFNDWLPRWPKLTPVTHIEIEIPKEVLP